VWNDPDGSPACHIGIKGTCTTAPKSAREYAYYRTGAVTTDAGRVSVGQITMGIGHAELSANPYATKAHYDDTGTVVADVAAGEDEFGIWVAGAIRPGATDGQRHALQAGALSGDWRGIGGNLELVAALVVNVPGFPVPRPALAASGSGQTSLVAAGVVILPPLFDMGELVAAVESSLKERQLRAASITMSRATINAERIAALLSSVGEV